jgi:hypothetical protein
MSDTGSTPPRGSPIEETLDHLLTALEKLPRYRGVSFRGIGSTSGLGFHAGGFVLTQGLVATSRDPRVATENFSAEGLYAVVGDSGRSLEGHSQHPDEREVVFLPGVAFHVVKHARVGDLPVVIVEELDPAAFETPPEPASLDEVGASIGRAVLAARELPPVPVSSPGKFVGDID